MAASRPRSSATSASKRAPACWQPADSNPTAIGCARRGDATRVASGRLIAQQPGQIAWSIIDAKAIGRFMPPVFAGAKAGSLPELARQLGLDESRFVATLQRYNAACQVGSFDHTTLDDCRTQGITPAK